MPSFQTEESNRRRSESLKGKYFPHSGGKYLPPVLVVCKSCGKEFSKKASLARKVKNHYCSRECNTTIRKSGEKPWNIGRINPVSSRKCPTCGRDFLVKDIGRGRNTTPVPKVIYCSPRCARPHLNEGAVYKRKSHFGYEHYYGPEWKNIKRQVLKEESTCQICDDVYDGDVDHIRPFDFFKDHAEANLRENLWRLCDRCHGIKTRFEDRRTDLVTKDDWKGFISNKLVDTTNDMR